MFKDFFEPRGIRYFRELGIDDLKIWDKRKWDRMKTEMGRVESAIILLIPYFSGQRTTNLSIYAQPRDYHLFFRGLTEEFREYCKEKFPDLAVCGFADSSPLDERDAALRTGLGVLGQNGLVINQSYGSYFFIGEFFLSRAVSPVNPVEPGNCPGCGACKAACPTGAICDPERKECLSLLSQKKKLSEAEKALVEAASCKWGCDLCQSVCPLNQNAHLTPIPFFREQLVTELTPDTIEAPEEEFQQRAFSWRGREVLRRNLKK